MALPKAQPQPAAAWEPFTPGGVAAFARASFVRVYTFQFVFALLNALTVGWFLQLSWFPVIEKSIAHLPASGEIRFGMFFWPGHSPMLLGYNSDLAFVVDLQHGGEARVPSDLLVELGRRDVRLYSLFGFLEFEYPAGWRVALNRPESEPWWGAWRPPILWVSIIGWIVALLGLWLGLSMIYALAVWFVAFFANRNANLGQSWRLAAAALMPASLVLWLGIVFYGGGAINLLGFLLIATGHIVVGWVYILVSPLVLEPAGKTNAKGNPFTQAAAGKTTEGDEH